MGEQLKTVGFAAAVCLICSLLLAVVYSSLKAEQDLNKANEVKIKVLTAFGEKLYSEKGKLLKSQAEIETVFNERISGKVLDQDGNEVSDRQVIDLTSEDVNDRDKVTKLKRYYPLYIYADSAAGKKRYAIHVSGMGLWSVVKGYMALEDDLATVAGVAFYDQQETPGLGGEVEKKFFTERFQSKKMYEGGHLKTFRILKPGLEIDVSSINGISGATMTCNGVAAFINDDFKIYNKYFEKIRN